MIPVVEINRNTFRVAAAGLPPDAFRDAGRINAAAQEGSERDIGDQARRNRLIEDRTQRLGCLGVTRVNLFSSEGRRQVPI